MQPSEENRIEVSNISICEKFVRHILADGESHERSNTLWQYFNDDEFNKIIREASTVLLNRGHGIVNSDEASIMQYYHPLPLVVFRDSREWGFPKSAGVLKGHFWVHFPRITMFKPIHFRCLPDRTLGKDLANVSRPYHIFVEEEALIDCYNYLIYSIPIVLSMPQVLQATGPDLLPDVAQSDVVGSQSSLSRVFSNDKDTISKSHFKQTVEAVNAVISGFSLSYIAALFLIIICDRIGIEAHLPDWPSEPRIYRGIRLVYPSSLELPPRPVQDTLEFLKLWFEYMLDNIDIISKKEEVNL